MKQQPLKDKKSYTDGPSRPQMKKQPKKSGFEKIRHRKNFSLSDVDDLLD